MNDRPQWNYDDLCKRLHSAKQAAWPNPEGHLHSEAMSAIRSLCATNKLLHRRAQVSESPMASQLDKLKWKAEWGGDWAISSFNRMGDAFREIQVIYDHVRRAQPDGCDDYGYHSVNDMRADGGPGHPGHVWANKFKSRRGGIVSVRPAEVIGPLIDELLELRRCKAASILFSAHKRRDR